MRSEFQLFFSSFYRVVLEAITDRDIRIPTSDGFYSPTQDAQQSEEDRSPSLQVIWRNATEKFQE